MAILNQTNDGLFHVLIILAKCLVTTGPSNKEKLLALCAPPSLTDQKMAKQTLRRWTQIGLFKESEEEIRFSDELPIKFTKRNFSHDSLAGVIRQLMYSPRNNERFWEKDKNRSADMCRLTAWMLAQDVHSLRPVNFQEPEDLYLAQIETEDSIFQNDTRWNGFKSWCAFLGFGATESGKAKGELIIDPTEAIRDSVRKLVPPEGKVSIDEFLDELANLVPVVDRGLYRREVESRLRREKWKEPAINDVSTSLSRALLRLRARGVIRLEKLADADTHMRLIGRGGKVIESVTHVLPGDAK